MMGRRVPASFKVSISSIKNELDCHIMMLTILLDLPAHWKP
jgi:hypothetical protein